MLRAHSRSRTNSENNMCISLQGERRFLAARRTSTVLRKTTNQCCMESDHVYGYRRIPSWLEEQLHARYCPALGVSSSGE